MKFITRYGTESKVYDIKPVLNSTEYHDWKSNGAASHILSKVSDAFKSIFDPNYQRDTNIKFDLRDTSGALVIQILPESVALTDIFYLQLLVLEKLKELGYILNLAEIKNHDLNTLSHILYMKPSVKLPRREGKVEQLFGNVHVEIKSDHSGLIFFKIIVHRYNDSNYHQGNPFSTFIAYLFG